MNNTIEKIESYISNIKAMAVYYGFDADEAHKEELNNIAAKTIAVLKETIERLKTVHQQMPDNEDSESFLNRVAEKTESVYTVTLDKMKKEHEAGLIKLVQENENTKSAAKMVETILNKEIAEEIKEKVISFIDSREVKEAIDKISLGALNVADKGLDLLIKLLDKDWKNGK